MLCNNMKLTYFAIVLAQIQCYSTLTSPCPKYFVYEPEKSEDDRWYGIITLESKIGIKGVNLVLHFDKSVTQFGNFLGKVKANSDNTIFEITNLNKEIRANVPVKEEIFVVYDPYYDLEAPNIVKIVFNRREICPKNMEQSALSPNDYRPSILVNINVGQCGTTITTGLPLITYGRHTVPGQWPWHVGLFRQEGSKQDYFCGGTLISDRHILTAAHCTSASDATTALDANKITIVLGKHGLYVSGSKEQKRNVLKITVHPNFNRTYFYNDISIIHLKTPVNVTDYVKPACLWEEDTSLESVVKRVGTAVGWGRDHENNKVTDLLMQAQMPVVDSLECIYSNRKFYSLFVGNKTFCAGFGNGTSVCNGDSGGGLFFPKTNPTNDEKIWQIRGIVSNTVAKEGFVCDPKYYVIFTDVAKYLNWIKEVMSD